MDERALRRPEFREGIALGLGDGQTWTFPRPTLQFGLVDGEGGMLRFGPGRATADDPRYDDLMETFLASTDGNEEINALANLAAILLRRNYELTTEQLRALLPSRPDDEANMEMWRSIADVAMGRAPKAGAATSGSPA